MRYIVIAVLIPSLSVSSTVIQTDWIGGESVQGPVSDWENTFWSTENVSFCYDGKVQLLSVPRTLVEHSIVVNFHWPWSIHSVDVDGDGDTDVIAASRTANAVAWWENGDGAGTAWIEHSIDESFDGASSVYSSDMDGDGDADVLGAGFEADEIVWWENTDGIGTSWTEHAICGDFAGAHSVYSCDIDGDGDADVLGAAHGDHEITWWENTDGTGTSWREYIISDFFLTAISAVSSDVDGDGDADVLGASRSDHGILWWENTDGIGTSWTEHGVDRRFTLACDVYSADVDNDGDVDVIGSGWHGSIAWWENCNTDIGIVWIEHPVDYHLDGAISVYCADMDGDGDGDILGAGCEKNAIVWWENIDGSGVTWEEHIVNGIFHYATSVCAADIDGNGSNDIIGASYNLHDIRWWDVVDYSSVGALESSILDAGDVDGWSFFLSTPEEPSGTSVSFQLRSSHDSSYMGAWSDTLFSPDTPLEGILADSTRYLQYKVILQTSDPSVSPELYEVAFSYTLLTEIEESESGEVLSWSLSALQNPSYGFFSALLSVPEAGIAELSIYDVAGRVVAEVSQEFISGTHSVSFSGLSEGVYFCTMCAGEFAATERIVVLD